MKVLVTTIPKSGTYLMGTILQLWGLKDNRWHVWNNYVDRFTGTTEKDKIYKPYKRLHQSLPETWDMTEDGSYVLGHVVPTKEVLNMLGDDDHIIVMKRDLRNAMISQMRFTFQSWDTPENFKHDEFWNLPMGSPEQLEAFMRSTAYHDWKGWAGAMRPWWEAVSDSRVHLTTFEDVVNGAIGWLAKKLDKPTLPAFKYTKIESRTSTDKHSDWEATWSPKIQSLYVSTGLQDLNRRYGYDIWLSEAANLGNLKEITDTRRCDTRSVYARLAAALKSFFCKG